MTRLGFEILTYQNNRMMKKETKQQNSTDTQMGYDTVLATVNVLDVIHDINMAIIFSDLIPEKTCGDFADVMSKVLTKHGLLEKYQEYMRKFAGLPPTL